MRETTNRAGSVAVVVSLSVLAGYAVRSHGAPPIKDDIAACAPGSATNRCGEASCGGDLFQMLNVGWGSGSAGPGSAGSGSAGSGSAGSGSAGSGSAAPDLATTCAGSAFTALPEATRAACFDQYWMKTGSDAPAYTRSCQRVAALETPALRAKLQPAQIKLAQKDEADAKAAAIKSHHCDQPATLCLDRTGALLGRVAEPTIDEGSSLLVYVLSPLVSDNGTVTVSFRGIQNADSLTQTALTTKPAAVASATRTFEWFEVGTALSTATNDTTHAIEVTFALKNDATGDALTAKHRIRVAHGHYFVEFGLEVPFVYRGNRTVLSPTVVEQSTEPRAALSAIIFLRGRAKDRVGYFGEDHASDWGLQIGTDFDLTKDITKKDYHLGIAWEPIAGFGVGAGLSFVQGQFQPPGDAMVDGTPPHRDHYILRPYFSVFLTTKFVDAAKSAYTSLVGP